MTPTDDLRARHMTTLEEWRRGEQVSTEAFNAALDYAIAALSALPAGGGETNEVLRRLCDLAQDVNLLATPEHPRATEIASAIIECIGTIRRTTPPPDAAVGAQGEEYLRVAVDRFLAWPLPADLLTRQPVAGDGWVDRLRIPAQPGLDPITVYFEDIGPGSGRMTVACYGDAWTAAWGAMGDRTVRQFVAGIVDEGYLSGAMLSLCGATRRNREYATKVARAVIAALAAPTDTPADGGEDRS